MQCEHMGCASESDIFDTFEWRTRTAMRSRTFRAGVWCVCGGLVTDARFMVGNVGAVLFVCGVKVKRKFERCILFVISMHMNSKCHWQCHKHLPITNHLCHVQFIHNCVFICIQSSFRWVMRFLRELFTTLPNTEHSISDDSAHTGWLFNSVVQRLTHSIGCLFHPFSHHCIAAIIFARLAPDGAARVSITRIV